MPEIKEYQPRSEVTGPVNTRRATSEDIGGGSRAYEIAGDALQSVGDTITRRAEQAEVSDLNAKMSGAQAEFTNRWREALRTAKPGDPELATRFLTDFDDNIGKIGDEVGTSAGRRYFNQASAAMRGHFVEATFQGQAHLAGVKAKEDYVISLKSLSSTLMNDPSSFELARGMHDAGLESLIEHGGLSREAAEELRTQGNTDLAKSSIRGWAKLNPEQAKKDLNDGKWDGLVGGDLKNQMLGEVDQEIRGRELEAQRRRAEEERVLKQKQEATQNQFLKTMSDDKLSVKDILDSNLDAFGSGSKEQFLQLLETHENQREKRIRTDPGTMIDLFTRIHLPDGDPKQLRDENELNAYFGKGLTMESLTQLRGEVQGRRTVDGGIEADLKKGVIEIAKGALTKSNPMLGIRDSEGDAQMQKFMSYFLTEFSTQRKNGKSAKELLDPDSPSYLGKEIRRFTRTPTQIINDMVKNANPKPAEGSGLAAPPASTTPTPGAAGPGSAPPPKAVRNPGESAADYLKRVKGK